MGIAGNSGNQTMTLMIRSIALGQVTSGNSRRLVLKEMAIAGLNGLVWGGVAGSIAWFIYRDSPQGWLIGLTLLLAMTLNMMIGSLVGMFIPMMLERSRPRPGHRVVGAADLHDRQHGRVHLPGAGHAVLPVARGRGLAHRCRYLIRLTVNSSWIVSL